MLLKEKQLELLLEINPMTDDYHTGIRKLEDIKSFKEAVNDDIKDEEIGAYPDFSKEDALKAIKDGYITIYSSHPIENGVFVTPSKMNAQDYAGGNEVYSKKVPLDEVAWINSDEGEYAKIDEKEKPKEISQELKELNQKLDVLNDALQRGAKMDTYNKCQEITEELQNLPLTDCPKLTGIFYEDIMLDPKPSFEFRFETIYKNYLIQEFDSVIDVDGSIAKKIDELDLDSLSQTYLTNEFLSYDSSIPNLNLKIKEADELDDDFNKINEKLEIINSKLHDYYDSQARINIVEIEYKKNKYVPGNDLYATFIIGNDEEVKLYIDNENSEVTSAVKSYLSEDEIPLLIGTIYDSSQFQNSDLKEILDYKNDLVR